MPSSGNKRESSNISEETASFLQKYQIPSYRTDQPSTNTKTENINLGSKTSNNYSTQPQIKKTQPYNYSNNYTTYDRNPTNSYSTKTENQGYTPLKPLQPVQPVQPLTENKPPIYNFSKTATESTAQVTGGFKKKKGPIA